MPLTSYENSLLAQQVLVRIDDFPHEHFPADIGMEAVDGEAVVQQFL